MRNKERQPMRLTAKNSPLMMSLLLGIFSCVSENGASAERSNTDKSKVKGSPTTPAATKPSPPKVQEEFQNEFARQVVTAGEKSEGWALFSSSSMEDNGQRWIIRSNNPGDDKITFCLIKQGRTKCETSPASLTKLTLAEFAKIEPVLKAGDSLDHIVPVAFDALTYEYLHAHTGVPQTNRVVFITGSKPLPAAYEALIKAFNR
jgi:hypothetical protein